VPRRDQRSLKTSRNRMFLNRFNAHGAPPLLATGSAPARPHPPQGAATGGGTPVALMLMQFLFSSKLFF
ncbi:hypothetical protein, partial [Paracoccus pantotrophus]|uniref:hypothetical protein n=1 Tax=Paracoccus pantotrophus TaxID=82367 RepID=UPI0023E3E489